MSDLVLTSARLNGWARELAATLRLGWPLILTNLAQIAMNTTDVVMMGWLGPEALAAGALGFNLYFPLMLFGIGVIAATAPMMARDLGRDRNAVREVRRTVRQGLWSAALIAVPLWLVLWQTHWILLAIGQAPGLAEAAAGYMRALQWAVLPMLLVVALRSFVSAMERPQAALWIAAAAIVLNAACNWLLMFGNLGFPRLELVGAGIASTLSASAMFAGLALFVSRDRRFRRYHLFGRFWRPDWPRLAQLWRVGLPIGATLILEVSIFAGAVFLMGLIGEDELAAHAIALQIASVTFMVPLGLGQATTVRVGRAYGAGDGAAIARAGWAAFAVGVAFMSLTALVMILAPRPLISIFLELGDPANRAVVEFAVAFLAFAALFQVFDGGQAVAFGMLRGLQDTRVPMLIAAVGFWGVAMPLCVVLGFFTPLSGRGIWLGLAIGLAVVATLLVVRWTMRERIGLTDPGRG